ncbi:hypothetical protein PVAND_014665 [Polypedilum vanderplanki]|uniref:Uncharacterized protein n=1 Tax=Polypedilum vanderplanki TaxID=319348 RepID=A0A9J6B9U6_POLVA|nr:hypothetical protein PVAND_014665 [Polypedilum vanderplanki]
MLKIYLLKIVLFALIISIVTNAETNFCEEREPCGWAKYTTDDQEFIEYTIKGTCICNPEKQKCVLNHQDFSTETHVYVCQDLNKESLDDDYWIK